MTEMTPEGLRKWAEHASNSGRGDQDFTVPFAAAAAWEADYERLSRPRCDCGTHVDAPNYADLRRRLEAMEEVRREAEIAVREGDITKALVAALAGEEK